MLGRPIAISLSPNTRAKDILLAVKLFFSPWKFFHGNGVKLLEQWFRQFFSVSHAISFSSGRAAEYAILKALDIGEGDEVLLQAYTCVVVPNAIIWTGAMPVYVDCTDLYTIDCADLESKITKKTKAILVQHTFGIPAEMGKILEIAKKYKLRVIEDCAHTIGGTYNKKRLGQFADAAFFSFGRDKAFSSVFGGMAITNIEAVGKKLRAFQRQQRNPSYAWVTQQLFHPIAFTFILPLYHFFGFGKLLLVLLQKIHTLSFPISISEKEAERKALSVKKLPNALAELALLQLKQIRAYNDKREKIAAYYMQELSGEDMLIPYKKNIPYLRFPVMTADKEKILTFMKKHNVYLGDWYSSPIDPRGVNFKKVFYQRGTCPNAERLARITINFPTYPLLNHEDLRKVIELCKRYYVTR